MGNKEIPKKILDRMAVRNTIIVTKTAPIDGMLVPEKPISKPKGIAIMESANKTPINNKLVRNVAPSTLG
jgi:hypothetical protein